MAVAVKTTAIKASAMEMRSTLLSWHWQQRTVVSTNTVPAGSVHLPSNQPEEPRPMGDQDLTAARICQRPGTLHNRLIVGVTPVELHQMGPRLSHEDRQRQRSTDGKPDL